MNPGNNNLNFEQIKFPVHAIGNRNDSSRTWKRFLNIGRVGSDCLETHYAGNDRTFYYVPLWMTTFLPTPPLCPKAVEPFRSRTEKLFRRINPFALIRTLATIPSSPRERRGFINYSSSIPLSIPGIRASIIVDVEQFLNNELLTGRIMSLLVMKMEGLFR